MEKVRASVFMGTIFNSLFSFAQNSPWMDFIWTTLIT
jgi:hypothetical protein